MHNQKEILDYHPWHTNLSDDVANYKTETSYDNKAKIFSMHYLTTASYNVALSKHKADW